MIIEIIVIILSFLITGYGIYRYGGNEVAERQNVVQGDEDDNNDDSDDLDIDNESRNDNDRNNGIINNNEKNEEKKESENNDNEKKGEEKENNRRINFAENFIRNFVLKNKSFVNLFEWGDIKETAKNLINRFPHINSSTNENIIEEILERIKKEEGENAFRQWLQQKYQGSIKSQEDKEKIITLFKRDKAANIYKNTTEEIMGFLNKIKEEEETDKKLLKGNRRNKKDLNSSIISIDNSENIININNEKMSFKEQVNEQIKKNKNNIDWGNLTDTARKIYNCLNKDAQRELNAFEKIENILKEKKSEGEKEAVRNWLDKNKEEIKNKDLDTIITMFISNKEANIYDISYKEIIVILEEKCRDDLSIGQYNQVQTKYIKLLEIEKKEEDEKEKELKKKKNIYEEESELAKLTLKEEPDENNPNVCHIKFRLPDGEKIKERRFLKTDKISVLYDYIKSIGMEIFMEDDSTDFDILYVGFPPKNLENSKNNTLESEGLYPNSILQISEKENEY